jgi:hypothetical protein
MTKRRREERKRKRMLLDKLAVVALVLTIAVAVWVASLT